MLTKLTRREKGVVPLLTLADKGGREDLDPPFLAGIIFEQPLYMKISDNLLFMERKEETMLVQ